MKILLFSRSIYPRTGGSSHVTEELSKNFGPSKLAVVGGRDIFFHRKYSRVANAVKFYYLPSQLSLKGRGERFFSIFRLFLFPINLIQACYITKREKPDMIIGTFPDEYYLLISLFVSRIFNIPYFSYFHNTCVENRGGIGKKVALWIEHEVFARSRVIFAISDGLRDFYRRKHPSVDKFETLVHTFSRKLQEMEDKPVDVLDNHHWNLAFTGNFNYSNMDATIRMVEVLGKLPNVTLNFYTPVPKALLELRGLNTNLIRYHGYLPKEDYQRELAKNDVMVLTHGFSGGYSQIEYETIFPTRTIELMLTLKPLFVHAPPNSFLSTFLKARACAQVVDVKDPEKIRDRFIEFIQNGRGLQQLVVNARMVLEDFYGPNVVKRMEALAEKEINNEI